MSPKHGKKKEKDSRTRSLTAAVFALAVALFTASAVYAGLTAVATGTETVTSGTLNLQLQPGDEGSAGLPTTFTGPMAPGDIDNVYVNLSNTGTLASAGGLTLWVGGAPSTALTNGSIAGEGLSVGITQCSVAWAAGACSGTKTPILASTPISSINTALSAVSLINVASLAAPGSTLAHLQLSLTLAGTETSVNGVPPAPTIQGLGPVALTYTFTEQQRTAITTDQ